MTTTEQWLALANRCEQATGADREIDGAIWDAAGPDDDYDSVPRFTASLDAATWLIGHEWLEWSYKSGQSSLNAWAFVYSGPDSKIVCQGFANTEPLARCAAFCRAMAEMGK